MGGDTLGWVVSILSFLGRKALLQFFYFPFGLFFSTSHSSTVFIPRSFDIHTMLFHIPFVFVFWSGLGMLSFLPFIGGCSALSALSF